VRRKPTRRSAARVGAAARRAAPRA
jgi:hypothetical protein